MLISLAATDDQIAACYPAMRTLRPHLTGTGEFVRRVRQQAGAGYRLAYVQAPEGVVAVAGFRIAENLAWGRFLYVDDLVTLPDQRSKGHGARLLAWLRERAVDEGCQQLHLDSGVQRKDAHRFYEREGMTMTSLHFAEPVADVARPVAASTPSSGP